MAIGILKIKYKTQKQTKDKSTN